MCYMLISNGLIDSFLFYYIGLELDDHVTVCNRITNQLTEIFCICMLEENFVHSNSERKTATTEVRWR